MSEKKERTYLIDDPQFSVLSKKGFFGNIPHSKQLGMDQLKMGARHRDGFIWIILPGSDLHISNPLT